MQITPEISACSIVLLGQFNPAIFHPAWLQSKGIEDEVSDFRDVLVHGSIAQFSFDARSYQVRTDRFQLGTNTAPWVQVLDIVMKIFGEHLHHTPISALGINREVHFKLTDRDARKRLGRALAPIKPWGEFGQEMDSKNKEFEGGLKTLTMQKKFMSDGDLAEMNVTVEPSVRITGRSGVYVHVNADHTLNNLSDGHGSEAAMTLLSKRFEDAVSEANNIINTIMQVE